MASIEASWAVKEQESLTIQESSGRLRAGWSYKKEGKESRMSLGQAGLEGKKRIEKLNIGS